jgi:agarase
MTIVVKRKKSRVELILLSVASLALLILSGCATSPAPGPTRPEAAAPFIKVAHTGNGYFFQRGTNLLYSLGVCVVIPEETWPDQPDFAKRKALGSYDGFSRFHSDTQAWARTTATRLESWGFNTAAAWCSEDLYQQPIYHARVVWFSQPAPNEDRLIDVFTTDYEKAVEQIAREQIAPHKDDPWLIGWFLNNELPWYGTHGWQEDPNHSLFDRYFALPVNAPGRLELFRFLHEHYADMAALKAEWDTAANTWEELEKQPVLLPKSRSAKRLKYAWAGRVADRYFSMCVASLRRHDPNHLILGCRFAVKPPRAVMEALAKYTDVVSINMYSKSGKVDLGYLRDTYALTKKPVLITEFSWRATENSSGDKNTEGAEVTVETQAERAEHYRSFVSQVADEPYIMGTHWFQYMDQPPGGRWIDGEDSDYGIVDIHDQPYEKLVQAMTETHKLLPTILANRTNSLPSSFDEEAWGEFLTARVAPGQLATPVQMEPGKDQFPPDQLVIHQDDAQGNKGSWEQTKEAWILTYETAGGWGLHGDLPLEQFDARGAQILEVELEAPAGLQIQVLLQETGDGPPGHQVYEGKRGADGESYELPQFTASGTRQVVRLRLTDAERRVYWGNQGGNMVLDTQALRAISFLIRSGQGKGQLRIYRVGFFGAGQD